MIKMNFLGIGLDDVYRFAGAVHKDRFFCAAAERFQSHLTGAGEEIEDAATLDIELYGAENRLFYLGGRGTGALSVKRGKCGASGASCNNSHL